MKPFLTAAALAAFCLTTFHATMIAADVGLSINVGQPGFYGQLNINDYPQPRVIYRQPIAIQRIPMDRPPIYLRVRPGHAKHWKRHCREYNACGERVYFVQNNWYNREYVPRYQEYQRNRGNDGRDDHGDNQGGDHRNEQGGNNRGHGRDH
ncbi:MAG: hypothetical protein HOP23_00860 [Methylococcaceae bacterium]|nr:hypothetical protein [Methylococcaceae bacterium]